MNQSQIILGLFLPADQQFAKADGEVGSFVPLAKAEKSITDWGRCATGAW